MTRYIKRVNPYEFRELFPQLTPYQQEDTIALYEKEKEIRSVEETIFEMKRNIERLKEEKNELKEKYRRENNGKEPLTFNLLQPEDVGMLEETKMEFARQRFVREDEGRRANALMNEYEAAEEARMNPPLEPKLTFAQKAQSCLKIWREMPSDPVWELNDRPFCRKVISKIHPKLADKILPPRHWEKKVKSEGGRKKKRKNKTVSRPKL